MIRVPEELRRMAKKFGSIGHFQRNQGYRREAGVYYTLTELYHKGKLTTWEMNTIDSLYASFIREEERAFEESKAKVEAKIEEDRRNIQ